MNLPYVYSPPHLFLSSNITAVLSRESTYLDTTEYRIIPIAYCDSSCSTTASISCIPLERPVQSGYDRNYLVRQLRIYVYVAKGEEQM